MNQPKLHISSGNIRMRIPTFSLPSHSTCVNSTPHCRLFCYAAKAERQYPGTRLSRDNNLKSTLEDDFVERVVGIIGRKKSRCFRIHESGEFYIQEYLDKWFEIAECCPKIRFLVYTNRWDLNWGNKPDNLVVYWSVWDDTADYPKDGLRAFVVGNKLEKYDVPINAHKCMKGHGKKCNDCMVCYRGESDVIFMLH